MFHRLSYGSKIHNSQNEQFVQKNDKTVFENLKNMKNNNLWLNEQSRLVGSQQRRLFYTFIIFAMADSTHYSHNYEVIFRGSSQIFFLNDGIILFFSSQFVHLNAINHMSVF